MGGKSTARSYAGESAEARRDARRARLLEAGLRCFGRDGFAATTTRTLCAEAGLTQRYVYESFADLETLFHAVCSELRAGVKGALVRALTRTAPDREAMVRAALAVYFRAVQENPHATRILLVEAFVASGRAELEAHAFMVELADVFRAHVFPDRPLPGVDERLLGVGLVGAVHHISLSWVLSGYAEPIDAMIETAVVPFRPLLPRPRGVKP